MYPARPDAWIATVTTSLRLTEKRGRNTQKVCVESFKKHVT